MHRYFSSPAEDLVRACADSGDAEAWEEFLRRFQPLIANVALRTARRWSAPSSEMLDDLVQETFLKLCADDCRLLRNFESRHPGAIFGFLKVVTASVVHDRFKATSAAKRGVRSTTETIEEDRTADSSGSVPSVSDKDSIERAILLDEIDRCLVRSVPAGELARSRRVFWLYYRCGVTASAIASLPNTGLSIKGVESMLARLTRIVREALVDLRIDKSELAPDAKGVRTSDSL